MLLDYYHYILCLTASPLFLHPLTSLIDNCRSLFIGTQGRLRTLKHQTRNRGDFRGAPMDKTSFSNARDAGSIHCLEAKIPHAVWPKKQNIKQKQYCNKFNKNLKKERRGRQRSFCTQDYQEFIIDRFHSLFLFDTVTQQDHMGPSQDRPSPISPALAPP